ncbi:helix-turn-helix transcriptional regulator [Streptomyces sp. NPDC052036]|uniref:helix-turn-helix domain-containing protein n=1 Tax=Streptomyces sp. NPDC052036 TaxID=3155171 RepID=UPI00342803C1
MSWSFVSRSGRSRGPAAQYFAEVLRTLRVNAGLSQNELGERMAYSGAAVSAVETCAKPATDEFIEAAEKALGAGGRWRRPRSTCGWSGIRLIFRGSCGWSRRR